MIGPDWPSVPPLTGAVLDRAAHRRTDPRWLADAWRTGRVLVVDMAAGGTVLVAPDGTGPAVDPGRYRLVLLEADEAPPVEPAARLFLGVRPDGMAVFAVDGPLPSRPGRQDARTLREVGHLLDEADAGLLTTAVALANWHARHGFSAASGRPTRAENGGWLRVDDDGQQTWPRTDPAMIVLVHDGVAGPSGRCLLGSNAAWRGERGLRRFSCLAGYVEPGESAEAAVVREVREEVGLAVDRIEYAGSQSWPFPGSLMLGFLAHADPDRPLRLDPQEIAAARWFTRTQIARLFGGEQVSLGGGWVGAGGELAGEDGVTVADRVLLPPPLSIAHFLIGRWLSAG